MDELKELLIKVSDCYSDFVTGVMAEARDCPEKLDELKAFIKEHPEATTSDIGEWTMVNIQEIDPENTPKHILYDDEPEENE